MQTLSALDHRVRRISPDTTTGKYVPPPDPPSSRELQLQLQLPSAQSSASDLSNVSSSSDHSVAHSPVAKTLVARLSFWSRLSTRVLVALPTTEDAQVDVPGTTSFQGRESLDRIIEDGETEPAVVLNHKRDQITKAQKQQELLADLDALPSAVSERNRLSMRVTNVVQSAFARHDLNKQLGAVALLNFQGETRTETDVVFNDVWANNGDYISRAQKISFEAIATSVSRVLPEGERLLSGWTLFAPKELNTKIDDKFEEKVLSL
ncbi:hypothetical protein C0993_002493, partial [Termitomyces sp. T159_Od127]